jgi:O-acetyl-ADP-ribose deacetylase (regulator of RNase III)
MGHVEAWVVRLLFVENHALFAANVRKLFLADFSVTLVPSHAAAQHAWAAGGFDVVLVDYDLDDSKGDQFVRGLRAAGSKVPVIGVSSHEEGNSALLQAGASAICSKMDFDSIRDVIAGLVPGAEPQKRAEPLVPAESPHFERMVGRTLLRLVTGDIADQDTDAVVTAAHWRLNKGAGTDGTIHSKGGPAIYEECKRIGGCPTGDAVITTGGKLKARHVIHAVGPVWHGGQEGEPELLARTYRRSLEVAVQNGLKSIAFPSISTGAFGYPLRSAAPVAMKTVVEFLRQQTHSLQEVRMVLYSREQDGAFGIFVEAFKELI